MVHHLQGYNFRFVLEVHVTFWGIAQSIILVLKTIYWDTEAQENNHLIGTLALTVSNLKHSLHLTSVWGLSEEFYSRFDLVALRLIGFKTTVVWKFRQKARFIYVCYKNNISSERRVCNSLLWDPSKIVPSFKRSPS